MTEEARVLKRARISGDTITIQAGKEGQATLQAHEDVIKSTLPFSRAALNKQWEEGQTRKICLPEDSSNIVACYVEWCYSNEIATRAEAGSIEKKVWAEELHLLLQLYVFGEKIQEDTFCDAVMTALSGLMEQQVEVEEKKQDGSKKTVWAYPGPVHVSTIYKGTLRDCPARRFIVDLCVAFGAAKWFTDHERFLDTPEFLRDFAVAQLKRSHEQRKEGEVYQRRKE